MAGATAQELAVRTAVASVADAATLLEKVDSPGRLYAPLTKAQLKIDLGVVDSFLELGDTPAAYDSADIGRALKVKDDLSGLEFTDFNSDNWDAAFSWGDHSGLYDATGTAAGTMSTHLGNFTHGDIALNTTHRGLTSGNPHSVTPTELSLVIGTNVQAHGGVLDDLNSLGANAADNEVLIGTGAGVLAWEKDGTLRTSLGLGTGDNVEFTTLTINQGTVNSSPGADSGIATKGYVDSLGGGGSTFWSSVAVASTEDVDISDGLENGDTIDGWTLVTGDRVLLKDQTDATENGLYTVVASGAASRSADADSSSEIVGRKCIILHGTVNYAQMFFCISSPITLGVTEIQFQALAGGGDYGVVELMGEEVPVTGSYIIPTTAVDVDTEWEIAFTLPGAGQQAVGTVPGGVYGGPIEFGWGGSVKAISKLRVYGEMANMATNFIRVYYYEDGWVYVGEAALTTSPAYYEFDIGKVVHPTKWKVETKTSGISGNDATYIYGSGTDYWDLTETIQHKISLEAYRPLADYTLTFPDDDGGTDQVMIGDGSGTLSWGGHDDLADFLATEHFLQTAITNVSTALSTGLLKVTTGTGALTVVSDASSNWNTAFGWGDHLGLYDATGTAAAAVTTHLGNFAHGDIATNKAHVDTTHDYAYISGNDGATGITAAELEELSDGSQTTLHTHAGGGGTFLSLSDTPAAYGSDDVGKYIRIKDDLSGLEFVEGGGGAFLDLTDTPASYDTADVGKVVGVKDDLTGLEFTDTFMDIVVADGGTIGQAAGPLLTFSDSGNDLGITGCNVGIGVLNAVNKLHVYLGTTGTVARFEGAGNEFFGVRQDAEGDWRFYGYDSGTFAFVNFGLGSDNIYVDSVNSKVAVGGLTTPKTTLTVEGALTLKEQAVADGDTAAYGQIFVKTASPNTLWFRDDEGGEVQLGLGGFDEFTDFTDTPASYDSGDGGKYVKVKDDLSGLEFDTPATASFSSRCSVWRNGNQTITKLSFQKVQFNAELYDNDNEFDSSSDYDFTAAATGYYHICSHIMWLDPDANSICYINVKVNSTVVGYSGVQQGDNEFGYSLECSKDVYLEAGDVVTVEVYHNSAGDEQLNGTSADRTYLTIHRFA